MKEIKDKILRVKEWTDGFCVEYLGKVDFILDIY